MYLKELPKVPFKYLLYSPCFADKDSETQRYKVFCQQYKQELVTVGPYFYFPT